MPEKIDFSTKAYLLPHINPEGVKFGMIAVVIALVALVALVAVFVMSDAPKGFLTSSRSVALASLAVATVLFSLLAYGVFMFFRDPPRFPPPEENVILSPADGKICLIQECPLPDSFGELPEYKGRKFWRVSVFMSVLDVHVNRMPTAGEILKKEYIAGKFFNASLDKASKDNERCNYLIRAENGSVYGVTQIAGLVARRIVPQVQEGDRLAKAQRFGLIRFGSRLDVYLPEGVLPAVSLGQTMVSGETVLGRFK